MTDLFDASEIDAVARKSHYTIHGGRRILKREAAEETLRRFEADPAWGRVRDDWVKPFRAVLSPVDQALSPVRSLDGSATHSRRWWFRSPIDGWDVAWLAAHATLVRDGLTSSIRMAWVLEWVLGEIADPDASRVWSGWWTLDMMTEIIRSKGIETALLTRWKDTRWREMREEYPWLAAGTLPPRKEWRDR